MAQPRQPAHPNQGWYDRPAGVPEAITAGGVIARKGKDGSIWLAAAVEQDHESLVLPKGHVEDGEDLAETARREVREEAGFSHLILLGELGHRERLNYARTEWKKTYYFLFLTHEIDVVPTENWLHDPPRWFSLDEKPALFWPEQNDLLEETRARIRKLVQAASA